MVQLFFEECDCDCHKGGSGGIAKVHIVACCSLCRFCGRRIKKGFETAHFERMHKQEVQEVRDTNPGFMIDEYIKDPRHGEV